MCMYHIVILALYWLKERCPPGCKAVRSTICTLSSCGESYIHIHVQCGQSWCECLRLRKETKEAYYTHVHVPNYMYTTLCTCSMLPLDLTKAYRDMIQLWNYYVRFLIVHLYSLLMLLISNTCTTVNCAITYTYFSSDTTVFVDRLFKGLDTESYLTGEDPPTVPSPPPKVIAPPSSSRSSKGDSKNERSETSSPLQSANRRPSEDIRHREVSCRTTRIYRPKGTSIILWPHPSSWM